MSTVAAVRRPAWSPSRWEDFGRRCQAIRDRLSGLITDLPETKGLRASDVNALINAHDCLVAAMIGAENVIARQHPDLNPRVIRMMHGDRFCGWVPCRGRVGRSAPILDRARWVELGREVKWLAESIVALTPEFQSAPCATKPYVRRFVVAGRAMDPVKVRLEGICRRQHPDWAHCNRVFYGPRDPEHGVTTP
jgi:hypothetical protein